MISRDAVLAEARKYDRVRWQHLGRSEHGIDCVGLVVMVCRSLELSDYDIDTYPREPVSSQFLAHFTNGGGTRIPIGAALPGDLMIFRESRFPCHVGILSERDGQPTIIHAHATRRMVLEEPMLKMWTDRVVAAVRLPGVG